MTLGQKLSFYRKKQGLTQQQLGEQINVTAQAVSKWENDQAEPDLRTLMKLSELYGTTLDALVSENELDAADAALFKELNAEDLATMVSENIREQMKEDAPPHTVGFCTACGIAVTKENLGTNTPKVLCRACKEAAELREAEEKARRQEAEKQRMAADAAAKKKAEQQKQAVRTKRTKRLITVSIFSAIFPIFWFCIGIANAIEHHDLSDAVFGLVSSLFMFAFISLLFFEGPVRDVIIGCAGTSIHWPGLIFEWSLDGFIWLIGMKLLFAALGFLAFLFMLFLGLALGFIIAPFVYPFFLASYIKEIKSATEVSNWE